MGISVGGGVVKYKCMLDGNDDTTIGRGNERR